MEGFVVKSQAASRRQLLAMRCAIIFVLVVAATIAPTNGCLKRRSEESGDDDGYYCVCNATYCDEIPDANKPLNPAEYILITSSKSDGFYHVSSSVFENVCEIDQAVCDETDSRQFSVSQTLLDIITATLQMFRNEKTADSASALGKITINRAELYQEIFGFGGSVTDSAAMNIHNLTHETSEYLLGSYFGPHGINYNFIRTPIGGADFSTRPYSYAPQENDTLLHSFDLQTEDYVYKIPIIKRAQKLRKGQIKLLSAAWSPPLWMKTNDSWTHNSKLRPEYRQVWADYFAKFFKAYRNNGIEFWGTTSQNEPENYKYVPLSLGLNGMQWSPEEERDWIVEHLAPTLQRNNFKNIKIFSLDDNRLSLPYWPKIVFQNKEARDIVSGVAIHFYFDDKISPSVLNEIKRLYPEKSLIYTEACNGVFQDKRVILGSWKRGEIYAKHIIENMSHWVSAWLDWNIALNTDGGPTYIGNYVDSPIIVNSTFDEFYKQPMFYVLGHFSKYVPAKSVRIGTTSENIEGIQNIAFSTPDKAIVLVILNLIEEEKEILVNDPVKGTTKIKILGKSITTMKYW